VDNQHREIKGYRELDATEIALMNEVKEAGVGLGDLVARLRNMSASLDQRWVSIGATHLQEGLMALTRAIAKPTFFVALCALLFAACTSGVDIQLPQHPQPQSLGEVLANVKGDTLLDLDAAQAIAVAHGDVIAQACYPVLKKYLAPATGQATVDQVVGLVSGFEKIRVERMAIESGSGGVPGIPADLRLGCAALMQTEKEFAIRMAALIAGGVVPGVGVMAPLLPK
jgi:hypothetical protein